MAGDSGGIGEKVYRVDDMSPGAGPDIRSLSARLADQNLDPGSLPEGAAVHVTLRSRNADDAGGHADIFLVLSRAGAVQKFLLGVRTFRPIQADEDGYTLGCDEVLFRIREEGCEAWFEAIMDTETVESDHFGMRRFPWEKLDHFLDAVVKSGTVWYGPGAGAYEDGKWVVTSGPWTPNATRGRTWCYKNGGEAVHEAVKPSFVCHTFVGFFLGYWYNTDDEYSPNWGPEGSLEKMLDPSSETSDTYDRGRRRRWDADVEPMTPPEYIIEPVTDAGEGVFAWRPRLRDNGEPRARPRYLAQKRKLLPTEIWALRHELGVITVLYHEKEFFGADWSTKDIAAHSQVIFKRDGKLYRMAADGIVIAGKCPERCEAEGCCHAELGYYDSKPLTYNDDENDPVVYEWFKRKEAFLGNDVTNEESGETMTVERMDDAIGHSFRMKAWRLKPLREGQEIWSEIIFDEPE